jgi:hypothetical protein
VSNFRSIKEHGKISAAALIPATWHAAMSVSRLICTEHPQNLVAKNRTDTLRPALPTRYATHPTTNIGRPLRFLVKPLMSGSGHYRSRWNLPGYWCGGSGATNPGPGRSHLD